MTPLPEGAPGLQVEIKAKQAIIRSGEVLDVNGETAISVWLQADGRRMHADNEDVHVHIFMDPAEARLIAVDLIMAAQTVDPR